MEDEQVQSPQLHYPPTSYILSSGHHTLCQQKLLQNPWHPQSGSCLALPSKHPRLVQDLDSLISTEASGCKRWWLAWQNFPC